MISREGGARSFVARGAPCVDPRARGGCARAVGVRARRGRSTVDFERAR